MGSLRVTRQEGPLVIAEGAPPFPPPHSVVWIGPRRVPGQVLHRENRELLIFYCGDPGVHIGEEILATGTLPAVWGGPGWLHRVHEIRFPVRFRPGWNGWDIVAEPEAQRPWPVEPQVTPGEMVEQGQLLAEVLEPPEVRHPVRSPVAGRVVDLATGVRLREPVARIEADGALVPVYAGQLVPLIREPVPPSVWVEFQETGVQVLDFFFPLGAGQTALLSGPRGTGKTALLDQIARFGGHDLVVYLADHRKRELLETLARQKPGVYLLAPCEGTYRGEFMTLLGRALAEYYFRLGFRVLQITDASCEWLETVGSLWDALEHTAHPQVQPQILSRLSQCFGTPPRSNLPGFLTHLLSSRLPLENLADPVVSLLFERISTLWRLDLPAPAFPPLRWTASHAAHAPVFQQQTEAWVDEEFPEQLREIRRLMEHYEALTLESEPSPRPEDQLLMTWARVFQRHFWHQPSGTPPVPPRRAAWLLRLLFLLWDWSRTTGKPVTVPDALLQQLKRLPLENPDTFQRAWERLWTALGEEPA